MKVVASMVERTAPDDWLANELCRDLAGRHR